MNRQEFVRYLKKATKKKGNVSPVTLNAYLRAVGKFEKFLNGRKPTKRLVEEYVEFIQDHHLNNGQQPIFAGLRHYLRFIGWKKELVKELVPIPRAIETKTEDDILTIADLQTLLNAVKDDLLIHTELTCIYYSALRRNELINLNIDDIRFEAGVVIVRNGKGMHSQPEEITPRKEFFDAVRFYLDHRPKKKNVNDMALFIRPKTAERINKDSIRRDILEAQRISGIRPDKRITPHWFRASILTHMNNAGASASTIMSLSRHRSFEAMKRYIRPNREQKKANIEKVVPVLEPISTVEPRRELPPKPVKPQQTQVVQHFTTEVTWTFG